MKLAAMAWLLLTSTAPAGATDSRNAIPIVYGWGEHVSQVAELPAKARQELRAELQHDVAVGFHYRSFHIFWCDLWCWDGQFVLFDGNTYWDVPEEELGRMLGAAEFAELNPPWLYRMPVGMTIVLSLVTLAVVRKPLTKAWRRVFPSDEMKGEQLLTQAEYRQAADIYQERLPGGKSAEPEAEKAAWAAAIAYLRSHGVAAGAAEQNLGLVLKLLAVKLAAEQARQVATLVGEAGELESQKNLAGAIEAYQRAVPLASNAGDRQLIESRIESLQARLAKPADGAGESAPGGAA